MYFVCLVCGNIFDLVFEEKDRGRKYQSSLDIMKNV